MVKKNNAQSKYPKANYDIEASKVRVIDAEGNMLGVMARDDAISKAKSQSLDLVAISPNAEPPVCKMLDYGKYKYNLQKKESDLRKKQKVIQIKEIKLRPTIDKHDYDVKLRNIIKFIEAGDKVKVSLRFRGREITHNELGMQLFQRIIEDTAEIAKAELEPKMEGRQLIMILVSK